MQTTPQLHVEKDRITRAALSGTTSKNTTAMTNLDQQRTTPRTPPVSGARSTPTRAKRDGPRRRVREELKNGLKNGIKSARHFPRREMKKEMNLTSMSPTETTLKNKTLRNGARTLTAMKSGTRSGEKYTDLTSVKNGATSGRLISRLAKRKVKTGDRHTQRTT